MERATPAVRFPVAADVAAPVQVVAESAAFLAGGLAVSCAAVLVLRRVTGAIESPPGPAAVLAACAVGLLLIAIGDLAARVAVRPATRRGLSSLPGVLTRIGLVMALAALVLPLSRPPFGSVLPAVAALLVSLAVASRGPAAAAFRLVRDRLRQPRRGFVGEWAREPETARTQSPSPPRRFSDSIPTAESAAAPTGPPSGSLLQRFERFGTADGGELIRGRICVMVPEGSRSGSGHLGFCPPFAATPIVEATTDYDGVEAVVTAAEVLPWGVRVECRLDEPAEEPIEIPVDLLAQSPA